MRTSTVPKFSLFLSFLLCSCGVLPQGKPTHPLAERPAELKSYYDTASSYSSFKTEELFDKIHYKATRFYIETAVGPTTIDYYSHPQKSENLIFVFPLLGGKNVIADYFAEYFARNGYDAAIVHRNNDFKDPNHFDQLEEVFRKGIVRDRIAIDFFEKEFSKKEFGTFGISRGAINVAMAAGVDPRLKYNVLALGGTDLASIFKRSNQRRLKFYRQAVEVKKGITQADFYEILRKEIRTAPEKLAQYMDPNNTLLMLSVLDQTVPFKYGNQLRRQIGNPRTVLMLADHYTSILFTQYAPIAPPFRSIGLFPFAYLETEAMAFYDRSFKKRSSSLKLAPFRLLQIPFTLIMRAVDAIAEP